jgi:hypothetical protein
MATQVQEEFKKVRPRPGFAFESWFTAGSALFVVSFVAICAFIFSFLQMRPLQQLLAFTGLALSLLIACGWRHALPYLPAISHKRNRLIVIGICWLVMLVIFSILLPTKISAMIMDAVDRGPSGNASIVALIWAGVPITACICLAQCLLMPRNAREHWGMISRNNHSSNKEQNV